MSIIHFILKQIQDPILSNAQPPTMVILPCRDFDKIGA